MSIIMVVQKIFQVLLRLIKITETITTELIPEVAFPEISAPVQPRTTVPSGSVLSLCGLLNPNRRRTCKSRAVEAVYRHGL